MDDPPFMFFGFNRDNNVSRKACPPGLKMVDDSQVSLMWVQFEIIWTNNMIKWLKVFCYKWMKITDYSQRSVPAPALLSLLMSPNLAKLHAHEPNKWTAKKKKNINKSNLHPTKQQVQLSIAR